MEPGANLDSLLARKLWRVAVVKNIDTGEIYMAGEDDVEHLPVPAFSTSEDAAMLVIEHFQSKGWEFRLREQLDDGFHALFYKNDNRAYRFVKGSTGPHAVCMAALAAFGGQNIAL